MDLSQLSANFRRPRMGRRLLALAASLTVMGVCIAIFKTVGWGADPCSTFTLGVSDRTGVSFGTCQLVFNLLLFLPVIRFDLSRIGIGTIGNMLGVGYIADLAMYLLGRWMPADGLAVWSKALLFILSMAAFLVAASFYMVVDLGVAPYDALPQLIARGLKGPRYRAVRMAWDISFLILGFLLGSAIGLTTLITGFCLGPAIVFVSDHVKAWLE